MAAALSSNPSIRISILDHEALGLTTETFGPTCGMTMEDWWIEAIGRPVSDNLAENIEAFVRDAVVIGFELPANLRMILAQSARLLVEIEVAPIRFMDDLLLTVTSANEHLNAAFARVQISQREIVWQLELARHHMNPPTIESESLPPRVALLAAQTRVDRSLVVGGALIDLAAYAGRIRTIADEHDLLLIAPHPHGGGEISGILALLDIPGVRITTGNSYRLLATGRVHSLVAISSSLLAEAKYFGVETICMGERQPLQGHMIRAQALGEEAAEVIAEICGFDLPRLNGKMPSGPVVQDLLGFNWGLTGIGDAKPALPAMALSIGGAGQITVKEMAARSALTYGWFSVESWGVWGGPLSICSFTWPKGITRALTCTLDLVAFTGDQSVQNVDLWIDGRKVSSVQVPRAGDVHWSFEIAPPTRPGPVQLWLVSKGQRPIDTFPDTPDNRLLSVGLKNFRWH